MFESWRIVNIRPIYTAQRLPKTVACNLLATWVVPCKSSTQLTYDKVGIQRYLFWTLSISVFKSEEVKPKCAEMTSSAYQGRKQFASYLSPTKSRHLWLHVLDARSHSMRYIWSSRLGPYTRKNSTKGSFPLRKISENIIVKVENFQLQNSFRPITFWKWVLIPYSPDLSFSQ